MLSANTLELGHYVPDLDPGTQGQGNQSANGLGLGCYRASRTSDSSKNFKGSIIDLVNRQIQIAKTSAHFLGKSINDLRTFPDLTRLFPSLFLDLVNTLTCA